MKASRIVDKIRGDWAGLHKVEEKAEEAAEQEAASLPDQQPDQSDL